MAKSSTASSAYSSTTTVALAEALATSQSSTIYVDLDITDSAAAAMLHADPPLHVEHDAVRDMWAVRRATDDEVAEAATPEPAGTASSSDA